MLNMFSWGSNNSSEATSSQMKGSVVRVWEKDPSVTTIGHDGAIELFLAGDIQDGPEDKDIKMAGRVPVKANSEGNFILDPKTQTYDFDTVNTFSYVHRTLNMYRRSFANMPSPPTLNWQWGEQAISVLPDAGEMENAYYNRDQKSLNFFHFTANNGQVIMTCRAQDIVAHETGHAVLDGICPGFMESYLPQTGAIHEAFGDISSMFVLLDDPQACEEVILKSKCDLHQKGLFLTDLANQFGVAIGQREGLRNANNSLKLSDVGNEVHALSQVFTGAIYNILTDMFHNNLDFNHERPSETLHHAAENLRALLLKALMAAPKHNASYADVANAMISLTSEPKLKADIRKEFIARGIDFGAKLSSTPMSEIEAADFSKCGGTLGTSHFKALRATAIEARKAEIEYSNSRYAFSPLKLAGY